MRFDFVGDTQKGILNYLYTVVFNRDNEKYFNEVNTYATSSLGILTSYAIDFNPENYWHAEDFKPVGEYIVIYFKSYRIRMTGFSITSSQLDPDYWVCHPKNWGFDASNDNFTWEHQINYTDASGYLNRKGATEYVGWNYGTYQYFRIMNTGPQYDTKGKNSMDLSQVEFFGDLLNLYDISESSSRRFCINSNLNIIVYISIIIL